MRCFPSTTIVWSGKLRTTTWTRIPSWSCPARRRRRWSLLATLWGTTGINPSSLTVHTGVYQTDTTAQRERRRPEGRSFVLCLAMLSSYYSINNSLVLDFNSLKPQTLSNLNAATFSPSVHSFDTEQIRSDQSTQGIIEAIKTF